MRKEQRKKNISRSSSLPVRERAEEGKEKGGKKEGREEDERVNGQRLFRHILLFRSLPFFSIFSSLSFSSPLHSLTIRLSPSFSCPRAASFLPPFSSSHRVLLELLFSEPELYMFCTDSSFEFLSLYFLQVSSSCVSFFLLFSNSLLNGLTGTISERERER